MDRDKRRGWLRRLKVGDVVLVREGHNRQLREASVDRITPTGQLTVGGDRFNHTGLERGVYTWGADRLVECTPDNLAQAKRGALVREYKVLLERCYRRGYITDDFDYANGIKVLRELMGVTHE